MKTSRKQMQGCILANPLLSLLSSTFFPLCMPLFPTILAFQSLAVSLHRSNVNIPIGGLHNRHPGLAVGAQASKPGQLHGLRGASSWQRVRAQLQQVHDSCGGSSASHSRLHRHHLVCICYVYRRKKLIYRLHIFLT